MVCCLAGKESGKEKGKDKDKESKNQETRYVITDIIGRKEGLGVENLRGSGMIAGETSLVSFVMYCCFCFVVVFELLLLLIGCWLLVRRTRTSSPSRLQLVDRSASVPTWPGVCSLLCSCLRSPSCLVCRLGQRCVQKQNAPIILTGFNALNKLLGKSVYTSNLQLGGPDIMYTNGVTHLTVDNDFDGILALLRWLAYVPAARSAFLLFVLCFGCC